MIQQQPQSEQPERDEGEGAARSNRRGLNLSLADRARGGKNSAKQQRRDSSGRFAGAVKSRETAGSHHGSSLSKTRAHASTAKARGRFDLHRPGETGTAALHTEEPGEASGQDHGRSIESWDRSPNARSARMLQEM